MGTLSPCKVSTSDSYNGTNNNPNPFVFEILKAKRYKDCTIVSVKYLGCTNFEGNKILVFEHLSDTELNDAVSLDPHFNIESKLIARFKPTDEGWLMALAFSIAWCD